MSTATLSTEDMKKAKAAKKYLLSESNPSFTGQSKANRTLQDLANKYNTTEQVIYDNA